MKSEKAPLALAIVWGLLFSTLLIFEVSDPRLSAVFTVAYRSFICGDVNHDGNMDISDLTYLVDYAFRHGPPPPLEIAADVDASGDINIADVTRWVDFSFKDGPALTCP